MNKYKKKLIKQFIEANDLMGVETNTTLFEKAFEEWLCNYKTQGQIYLEFLKNYGYSIEDGNYVEFGKGGLDSLVINDDFDTSIVSKDSKSFTNIDPKRFCNGKLKLSESGPVLVIKNSSKKETYSIGNDYDITFMTHNPYSSKDIDILKDIIKLYNKDIIVGAFGNILDKDVYQKIGPIKELAKELDNDYTERYVTHNGSYYYFLSSSSKKRTRK